MARAIFIGISLKDYWLATYVPISTVIKRAPMQYSDAYVYAEKTIMILRTSLIITSKMKLRCKTFGIYPETG